MAVQVTLLLDGREIPVMKCKVNKNPDKNQHLSGQDSPSIKRNRPTIRLVVDVWADAELVEWAMSAGMPKDGQLFMQWPAPSYVLRRVSFRNAYCTEFHGDFRADGYLGSEGYYTATLVLAPEDIRSTTRVMKQS